MSATGFLRKLGKFLWYSIHVPLAVLAASIFFVVLPWVGLESMATGENYYFAPFCIALGLILWSYLGRGVLGWLGVKRLALLLILIIAIQALYYWALAIGWAVLMADGGITHIRGGLADAWLNVAYAVAAIGIALLYGKTGYRKLQTGRHIELLAATAPAGVAYGLCEVVGRLTTDDTRCVVSPITGTRCLAWWSWNKRTRKGESYWASSGYDSVSMYCSDDSGSVALDFEQANFTGGVWTEHASGQKAERVVPEGSEIHVFGEARIDPDSGDRLRIGAPQEAGMEMRVSTNGEEELLGRLADETADDLLWALIAISCAIMLSFPFLHLTDLVFFQLASFVPPVLAIATLALLFINDLYILRNRVRRNRANIAVSLRKRADLWPQLEACAKQMLRHEPQMLERIAALRRLCAGELVDTPDQLKAFVGQERSFVDNLLDLVEGRLRARSPTDMQGIARQFVLLENEIAKMTEAYNDAVTQYHDRLESVSGRILALPMRLHREPLYELDIEFRQMPTFLRRD